eukprot:621955-Amphidinium_carterae.1
MGLDGRLAVEGSGLAQWRHGLDGQVAGSRFALGAGEVEQNCSPCRSFTEKKLPLNLTNENDLKTNHQLYKHNKTPDYVPSPKP